MANPVAFGDHRMEESQSWAGEVVQLYVQMWGPESDTQNKIGVCGLNTGMDGGYGNKMVSGACWSASPVTGPVRETVSKNKVESGMLAQAFNLGTQEAEAS